MAEKSGTSIDERINMVSSTVLDPSISNIKQYITTPPMDFFENHVTILGSAKALYVCIVHEWGFIMVIFSSMEH